jgi:hypothetical protein
MSFICRGTGVSPPGVKGTEAAPGTGGRSGGMGGTAGAGAGAGMGGGTCAGARVVKNRIEARRMERRNTRDV